MLYKIIISIVLLSNIFAWSQSKTGLIVGNGVRIRVEGNAKSNEISKVHGSRVVTILEESSNWDDLGKKDNCEKHKWVKVKWEGDSTGWVYGKYCFTNNQSSYLLTKETSFQLEGSDYRLCIFENFEYPVGDDEGLTGCSNEGMVYIFDNKNHYFAIRDSKSKEGEVFMRFDSNEGVSENIKKISIKNNQLIIQVEIGYQEGKANSVYYIEKKGGIFEVINYKKSEPTY